jgi:hypothetical protein
MHSKRAGRDHVPAQRPASPQPAATGRNRPQPTATGRNRPRSSNRQQPAATGQSAATGCNRLQPAGKQAQQPRATRGTSPTSRPPRAGTQRAWGCVWSVSADGGGGGALRHRRTDQSRLVYSARFLCSALTVGESESPESSTCCDCPRSTRSQLSVHAWLGGDHREESVAKSAGCGYNPASQVLRIAREGFWRPFFLQSCISRCTALRSVRRALRVRNSAECCGISARNLPPVCPRTCQAQVSATCFICSS